MTEYLEKTPKRDEDDLMQHSKMSFGDHLEELRRRLIKSLIGLAVGVTICLIFGDYILQFLAKPLIIALQNANLPVQLYVTSVMESFMTYIRVAVYAGVFISSPWIFYQLWEFVAAGLYTHERRYVHIFVPFSAAMFIIGCVFCIWIMAPVCCNYLINFGTSINAPTVEDGFITHILRMNKSKAVFPTTGQNPTAPTSQTAAPSDAPPPAANNQPATSQPATPSDQSAIPPGNSQSPPPPALPPPAAQPLIKPWFTLQSYISFIVITAMAFGLAFQMPLVVFILGRVNIVPLKTLKSIRKYAFFVILILAALLAPSPDVLSQLALAIPMYILYEIGILMLIFWPKHPK